VTVPGTDRTQETTALDVFMADTAFPAWVEPAYRGLLERVRSLEAALRGWEARDNDGEPPHNIERGTLAGGDLEVLVEGLTGEQADRIEDFFIAELEAAVLDVASPAKEEPLRAKLEAVLMDATVTYGFVADDGPVGPMMVERLAIVQALGYEDESAWLARTAEINAERGVASPATLPCGHPFDAAVTADEGTSYCGACVASPAHPEAG
jgi:hypothetical protein